MALGVHDAQAIVDAHHATKMVVVTVSPLTNNRFSYTKANTTFIVDLSTTGGGAASHSTYITIFSEPDTASAPYHANSLQVTAHIISLISTTIPILNPYVDDSRKIISQPYLMTPVENITSSMMMSLSDLRKASLLTPQQTVLVDLQVGKFLGQLHSGVMNEYYGLPSVATPADPSYSWQESFTLFLETLLVDAEENKYEFAYGDIRTALSRAIAFFLFDDVEVPSLVWLSGSADDIYMALRPAPRIAAILPNVSHALWGDPLLESFFTSSTPSEAMKEGYKDGGGEELLVFPRQKTKRLWYTLFLALLVISERNSERDSEKGKWALETVKRVSEELKTAPCY